MEVKNRIINDFKRHGVSKIPNFAYRAISNPCSNSGLILICTSLAIVGLYMLSSAIYNLNLISVSGVVGTAFTAVGICGALFMSAIIDGYGY